MEIELLFAKRLKIARLRANLSQKQLGILAGMDEFTASARVNQYERGKHTPSPDVAYRLAESLGIDMAFFYCPDDVLADIILTLHPSDKKSRLAVRAFLQYLRAENQSG